MKDKTCWLVLFTSWNHDLTDPNDDAWKPYYALAMDRGLEMKIGKLNVEEQPEVAAEFNVTRAEACGKRPTPKWNLEGYCDEVVVPLPRVVLVHRWGARPRRALPPAHTHRARAHALAPTAGRQASIVHAEDAPMELAAMNATINALLAVDGRWENGVCRKVGTAPPKEEL